MTTQGSMPPAEMMRQMRLKWLTMVPPRECAANDDDIVAAVMDWPLWNTVVTVLASSSGDASVYTTGTFGIIGGCGHEAVRRAALDFVACARRFFGLASPTTEFGYAAAEEIKFFFVTYAGVRSVSFPARAIERDGSPAQALFAHAQQVVTELRRVVERQRGNKAGDGEVCGQG